MNLPTLAARLSVIWDQQKLINAQAKLISLLREERNQQQLHHTRELQGLVSAWLIHIEQPELELRDELAAMEQALSERCAVLEEHIL